MSWRPTRRPALVGAALAAGTMLAACSGPAASEETSSDSPVQGGTLEVGFSEDIENYDPHQRPQLTARTISRQIADTLTDQDPETGEILPWLAESWGVKAASTRSPSHCRQNAEQVNDQEPETGEIQPWLAESLEVNEDSTAFTFHLRDDVTFSDGTPLDAAAVAANFDRIVDLGPLAYIGAGLLRNYDGSEVVDEYTVTVRFRSEERRVGKKYR